MDDVEEALKKKEEEDAKKKAEEEPMVEITPEIAMLNNIRATILLYEKSVQTQAPRFRNASIRSIQRFRAKLRAAHLKKIIEQFVPLKTSKVRRDTLLMYTGLVKDDTEMKEAKEDTPQTTSSRSKSALSKSPDAMDTSEDGEASSSSSADKKGDAAKDKKEKEVPKMKEKDLRKLEEARKSVTVEVECLLQLLVILLMSDHGIHDRVIESTDELLTRILEVNSRTLDAISARAYFYWALAKGRTVELSSIRSKLLASYRTCCLRHDEAGQAVLHNLIMQNYLHYNLFTQADKFRLNSNYRAEHGGAWQHARHLYYIGRIQAVQLHYSEAFQNLSQALRKAPQNAAVGFRQTCSKFLVIVQLLLGEIPERALFGQKDLKASLAPYFSLTQAVRAGDAVKFQEVMTSHDEKFKSDKTHTLIVRLRFNVIKTGLRNISLSYSRIHLKDIAQKLALGSVADTELIVAKAIYDGVIRAVIDKKGDKNGPFIFSKQTLDVYSTYEPQTQFHKRIKFCMDMHQEAVKALRYPDKVVDDGDKPQPDGEDLDLDDIDDALSSISDDSDHGDVM